MWPRSRLDVGVGHWSRNGQLFKLLINRLNYFVIVNKTTVALVHQVSNFLGQLLSFAGIVFYATNGINCL